MATKPRPAAQKKQKTAADKHFEKIQRLAQKQTDRRNSVTRTVDEKNRLQKRKRETDERYELTLLDEEEARTQKKPKPAIITNNNNNPITDIVICPPTLQCVAYTSQPMSLVFRELKLHKDPALLYSDIISNGRFYMEQKTQMDQDYLAKRPRFTLWDWQEKAIQFMDTRERGVNGVNRGGGLLCLDMGLGKTLTSLEYTLRDIQRCYRQSGNRYNGCTLILCQNVLLLENWLYEMKNQWPADTFQCYRLSSSRNRQIDRLYIENCCDIVITTYATLKAAFSYGMNEDDRSTLYDEDACPREEEDALEEPGSANDDGDMEITTTASSTTTASEYTKSKQQWRNEQERRYKYSVLYQTRWKRVYADEGHLIANRNTILYKAVTSLPCDINWSLTGTPLQNSLSDLRAQFDFIRVHDTGFPENSAHDDILEEEQLQKIKDTLDRVMLHLLKRDVMLNHSDMALPVFMPVTVTVRLLEFETLFEKVVYYLYATYASRSWDTTYRPQLEEEEEINLPGEDDEDEDSESMSVEKPVNRRRSAASSIFSTLLLMQQLCIGMPIVNKLTLPRGMLTMGRHDDHLSIVKTPFTEELFYSPRNNPPPPQACRDNTDSLEFCAGTLHKKTRFSYQSDSAILNLPDGYQFEYFKQVDEKPQTDPSLLYANRRKNRESITWNPHSRKQKKIFDLQSSAIDRTLYRVLYEGLKRGLTVQQLMGDTDPNSFEWTRRSSMLAHLAKRTLPADFCTTKNLHVIRYVQQIPSDEKVVVFSNSISALEDLHKELTRRGIGSLVVSGDSEQSNGERMSRFRDDPQVRVLLLSLRLGSYGLNLICANHIIFLHPWWNPQLEEQARNRVQRLGQTKPIRITHFIMNRTIELYMANLSYKKMDMTSSMIGRPLKKKRRVAETENTTLSHHDLTLENDDVKSIVNSSSRLKECAYNLYEYTIQQN